MASEDDPQERVQSTDGPIWNAVRDQYIEFMDGVDLFVAEVPLYEDLPELSKAYFAVVSTDQIGGLVEIMLAVTLGMQE